MHKVLIPLVGALVLVACSKETPPVTGTSTDSAASVEQREQELKQKEAELAQREADLAAKEREQTLAQREADLAAQEQELAKQKKAAEAAASKKASSKPPTKVASSGSTRSTASVPSVPAAPPPPERVEIPSGTSLTLALSDDISSKTAKPGDTLVATVASNVMIGGRVAVPTGSRVTGTITDVISGSRAIGATPMIGIKFNQLELEGGQIVPITGDLVEEGKSERGRDAAKILGGVAAGAVLGHQVKTNNRGKVVGGLLGGAVGAIAARNTGTEVQLSAGSTVTISTGEPFSVMVPRS